jgi:CDP-paratose 2-epimerase
VHGIDNNQRAVFFGPAGDTRSNQERLAGSLRSFTHHELDIRDRAGVLRLVENLKPAAIVHTAAQPSHDRAVALGRRAARVPELSREVQPRGPEVHRVWLHG